MEGVVGVLCGCGVLVLLGMDLEGGRKRGLERMGKRWCVYYLPHGDSAFGSGFISMGGTLRLGGSVL